MDSFIILRTCPLEYDTKIQEALLIKKLNPNLNKQLYAIGALFLLSIFKNSTGPIISNFLTFQLTCYIDFCFLFLIFNYRLALKYLCLLLCLLSCNELILCEKFC